MRKRWWVVIALVLVIGLIYFEIQVIFLDG